MRVPDTPTGNRWRQWKRIRRFLSQYGELDDQIAWVIIVLLLVVVMTPEALAEEILVLWKLIGGR